MTFSRKQIAGAIAGTLSLAIVAGCNSPAGTAPGTTTSTAPSPAASTATSPDTNASATPGTNASATPGTDASTTPGASPSVVVSAPPAGGKPIILSGNVYNETGATVDGAVVTINSLDSSVPYTASTTTNAGSWVVNNVPDGANIEIVAKKDNWTSRRRVGSWQASATGSRNIINFGGNSTEDPTGKAYFISDYPEVAATSPVDEDTNVEGSKLTFKLTMSEALDTDSQLAVLRGLRIAPVSEGAARKSGKFLSTIESISANFDKDGFTTDTDLSATSVFDYYLREGSSFQDSSTTKARAAWNADATELTVTFDAGLLQAKSSDAKYAAFIVGDGSTSLKDKSAKAFGTGIDGAFKSSSTDSNFIVRNVFKSKDLALHAETATGNSRWYDTHDSAVVWTLKRDEVAPKLTSLGVSNDIVGLGGTKYTRLELTYSEPMAAFYGSGSEFKDDTIASGSAVLSNYRFAVSTDLNDVEEADFDKTTDPLAAGLADLTQANTKTFTFNTGDFATSAAANKVSLEVDKNNPSTIFIWVGNGTFLTGGGTSGAKYREIRAVVTGIKDPAGNTVKEADAKKTVVKATI